jgi:hypothetical protein
MIDKLLEFYHQYNIWAWLFAILSGTICYYVIRVGEWLSFIVRARRRIRHLNVNCFMAQDNTHFPCKLWIEFKNWTNRTILLKIEGFKTGKGILPAPNADRDSTSGLLEVKFIEQSPQGGQIPVTMNVDAIIRHGEERRVWIPLDPSQSQQDLQAALQAGRIGTLKAELLWFDERPRLARYRPKIRRA